MCQLLLALLTAPALGTVPTPPPADVARTLDFATLTVPEATRLRGRRVRVVVELVPDTDDAEGGWTVYEAVSSRADDMRTVWGSGELEGGVQLVEGRLVVARHGAWGWFAGFVELRLGDARPVRTLGRARITS